MAEEATDLEQRLESMFDQADDLMINQKQYVQAVSHYRLTQPENNIRRHSEAGVRQHRRPQQSCHMH